MRRLWICVGVVLAASLLVAAPTQAQQAASPLDDVVGAGAPLVASAPSATVPVPGAAPTLPASGVAPGPSPAVDPAVGLPEIPNPLDLLSGLDPREWASAVLDAVIHAIGEAMLTAVRGFVDWALGIGDSSLNFVTQTPGAGSYDSVTVHALWDFSRAIANAGLALIVMWGGFNVVVKEHIRSPYHEAVALLPRVILAALALNLTLEFARLLIDFNNAFSTAVGQVGLPGYDQTGAEQDGMALIFVAVAYTIIALLLVLQMLMRLALIDVLIVLGPVMVLLWVLPQTQGWTRWWVNLLPVTVFQQAVQMVVLRLGSALMVELTPGSLSNAVLTLLLGIAVCWLTLKVPSLLRSQIQQAGLSSVVNLVVLSRAGAGLAGRGAAAGAGGAGARMAGGR